MKSHGKRCLIVPLVTLLSLGLGLGLGSGKAHAVDAPPPALGFCFGFGFGFGGFGGLLDIDSAGGLELLIPSRDDRVKLDEQPPDGFAKATLTRQLRLFDSNGADLWGSAASLVIGTDDLVLAVSDDVTPAKFMQLLNSRLLAFYPFPFICEGYGVAESGGQRYVIANLGVSAAEGNEMSGSDLSVIKVFVINASTGAIVKSHKFAAQGANFLLLTESGVADFDGDGNDEIVIVRTVNLGPVGNRERIKIVVEVFNLVTGALKKRLIFYRNDTFVNDNPLPP